MPGFNDNETTARNIASTFTDARVRHFYDAFPAHVAGKAFAEGRIPSKRGPAWDIYFFYSDKDVWTDGPPEPTAWMHQLGGIGRADAAKFRSGDDLVTHLHAAMHLVTGQECNKP